MQTSGPTPAVAHVRTYQEEVIGRQANVLLDIGGGKGRRRGVSKQ